MTTPRIKRRTGRSGLVRLAPLVAGALLLPGACGEKSKPAPIAETSPSAPPASARAATPTPSAGPGKATAPPSQSPAARRVPAPANQLPKTVTFGNIAFSVPRDWGIDVEGDTAFVGVLAGGTYDVALRVQRNFSGSTDSLKPTSCPRDGDPPEPAVSVSTAETGFRPVGDRRAEYRLWRVTCPGGEAQEHRVWVLPTSGIAIYEQVHDPSNVDVVTNARVQ